MAIEESSPARRADGVTRRRFLTVAAAVALAPLIPMDGGVALAAPGSRRQILPRAVRATAVGERQDLESAGPLSVGYIDGSAHWPDLRSRPWADDGVLGLTDVVPATALPGGDSSLVGQIAIVTVHGLYPGPLQTADRSLRHITLDADFDAADPASARKFFAWTLRTGPAESVSGRSVFRIHVTESTRLGFDLAVSGASSSSLTRCHLGVGGGARLAKLHRGAYLLALRPGTWDAARHLPKLGDPQWRQLMSLVVTVDHE